MSVTIVDTRKETLPPPYSHDWRRPWAVVSWTAAEGERVLGTYETRDAAKARVRRTLTAHLHEAQARQDLILGWASI